MAFATLGCKTNWYDTASLAAVFRRRGYRVVDFGDEADVYVINTCVVTGRSAARSRQVVRQAVRRNPDAVVVVAGCYPQTEPDQVLSIPGVDVIIGVQDREQVVDLAERAARERRPLSLVRPLGGVREFEEIPCTGSEDRTRAVVKVQEGCTEYCSYCIVPFARGPVRSRHPDSVLAHVRTLAGQGFKEVVLTGTHLGAYGRDLDRGTDLAGLLRRLHDVEGIERLRLSSVEPMDVTEDLIVTVATWPRICRHLHLPLQSGADEILHLMRRRYSTTNFRSLVRKARDLDPDIGITTDVMVGFPGETEEHFRQTFAFVREMAFSRMHVFRYSRRPGTEAATFENQVPPRVARQRTQTLQAEAEQLSLAFHRRFLGRTVDVLVEADRDRKTGLRQGLTGNYIRVLFDAPPAAVNRIIPIEITGATPDHAMGSPGPGGGRPVTAQRCIESSK